MSLHVDVLILKTNNDEIRKCTYFTALDNCDQDVVDTLFKHYTNQLMLIVCWEFSC